MEVKVHYSKAQMEATIRFIGDHNRSFLGQYDYIRASIEEHITEIVHRFPHATGIGTMGYYISMVALHQEGIDHDDNLLILHFAVDPAVGDETQYSQEDAIDLVLNSNRELPPPIME
jgi:hypothetical protein